MNRLPILILAGLLAVTSVCAQELNPQALSERVAKLTPRLVAATVGVLLEGGAGSGVIVSPEGLIMTAAHVTGEPGKNFTIHLADGQQVTAVSLGVDHQTDLGLMKINVPGTYPYAPYIREKNYAVGDWVLAVGHPGGPVVGRPSPVRLGRITRDGVRSGFTDPITSTAAVISGDSGGPLYNLKGEVIGINSNITGSWDTNNHGPVLALLEKWDALMASQSFGRAPDTDTEKMIDDPFADLREKHRALLKQNASDPEAADLIDRPRLLDPHHLQAQIDRWAPDPESELTPYLGLHFDMREGSAKVAQVVTGSPAEAAGLKPGDVLTRFDETPIPTPASLARVLKRYAGGAVSLEVIRDQIKKTVALTPSYRPARQHFAQPLAAFMTSMLREGSDVDLSEHYRSIRDAFDDRLAPLATTNGVVEIFRAEQRLALATVVSTNGLLITKASALGKTNEWGELRAFDQPMMRIATDEKRDLALFFCQAARAIVPIEWDEAEPQAGALLVSPTPTGLRAGVLTQPLRPAPRAGFDYLVTPEATPPWLGIVLDPDATPALISRVDPGSPAAAAGLLEGDVLSAVEGTVLENGAEGLREQLRKRQPGERFSITVERAGEVLKLRPILGARRNFSNKTSVHAVRVDQALSGLSERGGQLSHRRQGFPAALYHDARLAPEDCGGPICGLDGKAVGINISRSLRHRSLAIPASDVIAFIHLHQPEPNKSL